MFTTITLLPFLCNPVMTMSKNEGLQNFVVISKLAVLQRVSS